MKKILFMRCTGAFGGIEVLLMDWMQYIDHEQNSVFIGSTIDLFSEKIKKIKLPVQYNTFSLPVIGGFLEIFLSWFKDIKTISPDQIVIMDGNVTQIPFPAVMAAYFATRGNVYMTEHLAWPFPPEKTSSRHFGIFPGLGMWWYKMMWTVRLRAYLAKRILAVSEGVKNVLLLYGYPAEKIAIAYHGVDVSRFSPSGPNRKMWRAGLDIPGNALVFVSTARLAREKRLDRIIKAFDTLSQDHDDIWLIFAGDGPIREELESMAQSARCRDRIKLLGLVDNVHELLQASDIFVLPSDREGLSVSLTEAMAAGLICIASDVSGSNEVIRNGDNGFLVEPNDEGVFRGMENVLNLDAHTRDVIARKARDSVVEKFEMRKSVTKVLEMLDIERIAPAG